MRKFIDIITESGSKNLINRNDQLLLLLEANKAYEQMMDSTIKFLDALTGVTDFPSHQDYRNVAENIKVMAKRLGNGHNLATWFTRLARAQLVATLEKHPFGSKLDSEVTQKIMGYVAKIKSDYMRQTKGAQDAWCSNLGEVQHILDDFSEKMQHFKTVDYAPIQDYNFTDQTYQNVISDLQEMERSYLDRMSVNRHMTPREDDTMILKMGNGFSWWRLPRASCNDERSAMGHCGNTASPRPGQNILSLREDIGEGKFIPHATFILNPDGSLGERKGYQNHKVPPRLFPYVVELLKQKWIKGLVLGAHFSSNDFAVDWLPQSEQEELLKANPNLFSISDRYAVNGLTKEIAQQIATGVKEIGKDWYRLNDFSLVSMSEEDRNNLFDAYPFLMSLDAQYKKEGMTREFSDILAQGIERDGDRFITREWPELANEPAPEGVFTNMVNSTIRHLPKADLHKFWDFHPEIMTVDDRYERFGLSDSTIEHIFAIPMGVDLNRFVARLSPEDRETLFTKHPELMNPDVYYSKLGMTEELITRIVKQLDAVDDMVSRQMWFNKNSIALHFSEGTSGMWRLWFNKNSIEVTNFSVEDTDKLFENHRDLLLITFPHSYYRKYGVDEKLTDLLMSEAGADHMTSNTYNKMEIFFPLHDPEMVPTTDLDKILDMEPLLTTASDYYRRNGLTEEFSNYLNHYFKTLPYPESILPLVNLHFSYKDLSPEDLEKFFDLHPDMMELSDNYRRNGANEQLLDELNEGWENDGKAFFAEQEFFPHEEFTEEDKIKVMETHPQLFPITYQLGKVPNEDLVSRIDHQLQFAEDSPFSDVELEGDSVVCNEWSDVDDFIDDIGDETLKYYGKSDEDRWFEADGEVSDMDDIVPYLVKRKIMDYAKTTYGPSDDADEDETHDYEDTNFNNWDEVVDVLKEEDDEIHDALRRGADDGASHGAEAEAQSAVYDALMGIQTELGHFELPTNTREVHEYIMWDNPVKLKMTMSEIADFVDNKIDNDGYCEFTEWTSFLRHEDRISMRDEFYGFDKGVALENFLNELDSEFTEGADNPYRKMNGANQERENGKPVWISATRKQKIAEVNKINAAMGKQFNAQPYRYDRQRNDLPNVEKIEDLNDDELDELFKGLCKKYYI